MNNALAIFDIGSNAVRLTIYGMGGTPNTRPPVIAKAVELCELGRFDPDTQALYPPGVDRALKTLDRFCQMVRNPGLNVTGVVAVGTEALRRASNGGAFATTVKTDLDLAINILSEHDEGIYGARGVLAHTPNATGMIADLGGGSLQLTRVEHGMPKETHSMPLGTLRLLTLGAAQDSYIDTHLQTRPSGLRSSDHLYVIGGSWRSLAKLYLSRSGASFSDVDGLVIDIEKMRALAAWLNASPASEMTATLTEDYHLEPRRAEGLPSAAQILMRLIDALKISRMMVSSAGIRDGILQAVLTGALQTSPIPKLPSKDHRGGA